jgi:Pyruvate/2-oxoacid:ferredoxin oxidoreductase delta subunit
MAENPYKSLARKLDSLPEGFPETPDGAELRILEHLFSPQEAELASKLRLKLENAREIQDRIGGDFKTIKNMLKGMSRKGLIRMGKAEVGGLGFGLMPFVVGIYELQTGNMDAALAKLFEDYYQQAFVQMTEVEPKFHRVIPVGETIRNDMSIEPFENAATIIENAKAWGVTECICRQQKALIGDPCDHPLDVCMTFSQRHGAYDNSSAVKALTKEEAYETLKRASDAGLVHSVSNNLEADSFISHYICNCCTCSCGILRGISEKGMSNVIARSAFVCNVDPDLCTGCDLCIEYCQFDALSLSPEDLFVQINQTKCVGCGVCIPKCPEEGLSMIRRPENEVLPIPPTHEAWLEERSTTRGMSLGELL